MLNYTYEKNLGTTQAFSGGTNVLGLLSFAGSDETDTFGANANLQLVPEKWTLKLNARRQKLDGLMASRATRTARSRAHGRPTAASRTSPTTATPS